MRGKMVKLYKYFLNCLYGKFGENSKNKQALPPNPETKALSCLIIEANKIYSKERVIKYYRIVETDNFGRDYPDEKFLNLPKLKSQIYLLFKLQMRVSKWK